MAVYDPTVIVECDRCGTVDDYPMTALVRGSWDNRTLKARLEADGWVLPNGLDGETICEDCAENEGDD